MTFASLRSTLLLSFHSLPMVERTRFLSKSRESVVQATGQQSWFRQSVVTGSSAARSLFINRIHAHTLSTTTLHPTLLALTFLSVPHRPGPWVHLRTELLQTLRCHTQFLLLDFYVSFIQAPELGHSLSSFRIKDSSPIVVSSNEISSQRKGFHFRHLSIRQRSSLIPWTARPKPHFLTFLRKMQ